MAATIGPIIGATSSGLLALGLAWIAGSDRARITGDSRYLFSAAVALLATTIFIGAWS